MSSGIIKMRNKKMTHEEARRKGAEAIVATRRMLTDEIEYFATSAALWAEHDMVGMMRHMDYGASRFEPIARVDEEIVSLIREANGHFRW